MSTIDTLLGQIEEAIRLDYAAKIALLEEERDAKIARVRVALGDDAAPAKRSAAAKAPRPAPPPARKEGEARPTGKGPGLSEESRVVREWARARTSEFTTRDAETALPKIHPSRIRANFAQMASRGELRRISTGNGRGNRSAYAPALRPNGHDRASAS
jgi:hypothetical protein